MPDARATVAARVRRQRDGCELLGSPLYAGLLDQMAHDVEAGGPAWEVLAAFADWPGESAYVLRVMGAVNRLVLTGSAPEVAPFFVPGADAAAAWEAFRALLAERGDEVQATALEHPVQTNEVGRCAALAPAFLWLSGGRPLRLLEIGASGGLNLRWDAYRYEDRWGDARSPVRLVDRYEGAPPPFEPATVEVVERRGCDRAPVDAASGEGALTLLSFVWPDQAERVALLRGALEVARRIPVAVERADADAWLEEALAGPLPDGVVTVVFHSIVWQYVEQAQRDRIRAVLAAAGARATERSPLAWLRMESAGADTRLDVTVWPGGDERRLGRAGYHGRPVRWLA
jgi:hypothetical protein